MTTLYHHSMSDHLEKKMTTAEEKLTIETLYLDISHPVTSFLLPMTTLDHFSMTT